MKKGIIALSVISVIAIVTLIIYLVMKKKDNGGIGLGNSSSGNSSEFPLKYNLFAKSSKVMELQAKLNKKLEVCEEPNYPKDNKGVYIKSLKEDGYFGDNTLAVVKYFCNGKEEVTEEMFNAL